MGEDLVFIYKIPIILIFIFIGVAIGVHFWTKSEVEDLTKHYAEITAVSGGFTSSQYKDLQDDLKSMGLDPVQTTITIKATAPDGTDISSRALNVDSPNKSPYPANAIYCPRGTKITLIVDCKTNSIINNAFKAIGQDAHFHKAFSKKVYMSERVK